MGEGGGGNDINFYYHTSFPQKMKPFKVPQRSVKIKIITFFYFN